VKTGGVMDLAPGVYFVAEDGARRTMYVRKVVLTR
jgi:hypothetical protein